MCKLSEVCLRSLGGSFHHPISNLLVRCSYASVQLKKGILGQVSNVTTATIEEWYEMEINLTLSLTCPGVLWQHNVDIVNLNETSYHVMQPWNNSSHYTRMAGWTQCYSQKHEDALKPWGVLLRFSPDLWPPLQSQFSWVLNWDIHFAVGLTVWKDHVLWKPSVFLSVLGR